MVLCHGHIFACNVMSFALHIARVTCDGITHDIVYYGSLEVHFFLLKILTIVTECRRPSLIVADSRR